MKTLYKNSLLISILFFSLSAFLSADNSNVFYTETAPVTDGVADQVWDTVAANRLEKNIQGSAESAGDFQADYKVLYDDENMYFLVRITDDLLVNDSGIEHYFDADSVSLFFDTGNEKTPYPDDNDRQFSFVNGLHEVYSRENLDTAEIIYAFGSTDGQYILEIMLPMSLLADNPLQNGQVMGFDLLASDFDSSLYRDCLMSWSGDDADYYDSSRLGQLILTKTASLVMIEAETTDHSGLGSQNLNGTDFLFTQAPGSGSLTHYEIDLANGVYQLWVKAWAKNPRNNTFQFMLDNETPQDIELEPRDNWQWICLDMPDLVFTEKQNHMFTLLGVSQDLRLDKMILSNNKKVVFTALEKPAGMTVKQDNNQVRLNW